jgi:hypothetical protein
MAQYCYRAREAEIQKRARPFRKMLILEFRFEKARSWLAMVLSDG